MKDNLELTVLMPCLNEELTLATCIRKAKGFMDKEQVNGEVLIADNGSTDQSVSIAKAEGARVVHVEEKGYGSALRGGIANARGTYVIMGDADDSYDFSSLMPFVKELRNGGELVMGNRFKGGIEKGAMPFLHRYLGNPVLSLIGRLFFNIPIGDFHCGLRGFHRERMLQINPQTSGMEFASEMVVKSSLSGLDIREVPTTLSPDGRDRPPHLNTWRDGWRHLKFLLIYSPAWSLLYPGMAIFFIGLLLTLTLLGTSPSIGPVVFDIHTLLVAATFCFVGFQLMSIFVFSKAYGISKGYLPKTPKTPIWSKLFILENSLKTGGILLLLGLGLVIYSIFFWSKTGFSELDPSQTLRLVIPGVFLIMFSIQLAITGFLLELLK
ncbi:MAG: glycosyltransferase family 2 protein [Bacteroidota bacterium]